jgi:hypothetical protein
MDIGVAISRALWEVAQEEAQIYSARSTVPVLQRLARELPFWQWAERSGLWIDRETFNYRDFAYLKPIYESFPDLPASDDQVYGHESVVRKSAQGGGSIIYLLWAGIYLPLRRPMNVGYYLPDETTTYAFSDTRYKKMMQHNPDLLALMEDRAGRQDIGSKSIRKLGPSTVMFLYTGMNMGIGQGQRDTMRTEAMPLDVLVFDEVQGMTRGQIEKTRERVSASFIKGIGMVSTPKWPEADIDEWFQNSDQQHWHSDCRCSDGIEMAEQWPECIAKRLDGRVYYRCPHCDTEIVDPQRGRYIAHNPGHEIRGFTFGQTASRRVTASEMLKAWDESHDKQNFYNRKLGRPYSNPNEIPINLEILKRCYRTHYDWPGLSAQNKRQGENFLGLDHMGNLNVIVVKRRIPGGKERILHLEWIEDSNPFVRAYEIMTEYNILYGALESLPNFNEAFQFAKEFEGRVFVIEYGNQAMAGEMLRWRDRTTSDPDAVRRTVDEARNRFVVSVDQYKFMSYALGKIQDGNMEMPDPLKKPLLQRRLVNGRWINDNLAALFTKHLTKVALISERRNEKEERRTNRVEKIGSEDPHFVYANMCADVAISRAYGTTRLVTHEIDADQASAIDADRQMRADNPAMAQLKARIPHIGQRVSETCGGCNNFNAEEGSAEGRCLGLQWHNQIVRNQDPKCDDWLPRDVRAWEKK